jgi:predicted thioesterase
MRREVTRADTADEVGSGDVPVLATPRLIAWLEEATVRAATAVLGPGETSVGTAIHVHHRRATAVGGHVEVSAEPPEISGRHLTFAVRATDEAGVVVADGQIERVVVDRERFLDSVGR